MVPGDAACKPFALESNDVYGCNLGYHFIHGVISDLKLVKGHNRKHEAIACGVTIGDGMEDKAPQNS